MCSPCSLPVWFPGIETLPAYTSPQKLDIKTTTEIHQLRGGL